MRESKRKNRREAVEFARHLRKHRTYAEYVLLKDLKR